MNENSQKKDFDVKNILDLAWKAFGELKISLSQNLFEQILIHDPMNHEGNLGLAIMMSIHHRFLEALEYLNKHLESKPESYKGAMFKVFLLCCKEENAKAKELFDDTQSRQIEMTYFDYLFKGWALKGLHENGRAIDLIDSAIKFNPDIPIGYYSMKLTRIRKRLPFSTNPSSWDPKVI